MGKFRFRIEQHNLVFINLLNKRQVDTEATDGTEIINDVVSLEPDCVCVCD